MTHITHPEQTTVYYPAKGLGFSGASAGLGAGDTYADKLGFGNPTPQLLKAHEAVILVGQEEKNEPIAERIGYWLYETFDIPPNSTVSKAVWEWTISARNLHGVTDPWHWRTGILIPDGRFNNQHQFQVHPNAAIAMFGFDTLNNVIMTARIGQVYAHDLEIRADHGLTRVASAATHGAFPTTNDIVDRVRFTLKDNGGPARGSEGDMFAEIYTWTSDKDAQQAVYEAPPLATSDIVNWDTLTGTYAQIDFAFTGINQITLTVDEDYVWVLRNATNADGTSHTIIGLAAPDTSNLNQPVTWGRDGGRLPYFSAGQYLRDSLYPFMMNEDSDVVQTNKFVGGTVFPSNTTHFAITHDNTVDTWTMGDSTISPTPDFVVDLAAKLEELFARSDYGAGGAEPAWDRLVAITMAGIDDGVTEVHIDSENATLGAKLTITFTPPADPDLPPGVPPDEVDEFSPTETSIANGALTLLGERRINSLDDGSVLANMLASRFDDLRDALLRLIPWNFATKRAQLSNSPTAPVWEFARSFPFPEDFIRLLEVDDGGSRLPYVVEERNIVTSISAPLDITYTSRVEDPALMDPLFRDCLSAFLAVEFAEALTGGGKISQVFEIFKQRLVDGGVANGQETEPLRILATEWEAERGRDEER